MINQLKTYLFQYPSLYLNPLMDIVSCNTEVKQHGVAGGNEKNGQQYLEKLFTSMGATIVKSKPNETCIKKAVRLYNEGNKGHNYNNRYNVYAHFNGNSDRTLLFNGHIDTVAPSNPLLWDTSPYTPTIKNGYVYGLGSCDMKGGLMAAIMAVKLLQDCGYQLPCNVTITSVVDEEGGGNGSIQAVFDGIQAGGVVVCEPTSNNLVVAHMGFLLFRINLHGRSVHAGLKAEGVSAIDKAIKLIQAFEKIEKQWQSEYTHEFLPPPSLNIGTIKGGSEASTVSGSCLLEVCVHYLPQMSRSNIMKELAICIQTVEETAVTNLESHIYQSGSPFSIDCSNSYIELWRKTFSRTTGRELVITGSPAGCDSRIWSEMALCPTVQFGPGNIEQCHTVNEYISIESYMEAILVYANIILNF